MNIIIISPINILVVKHQEKLHCRFSDLLFCSLYWQHLFMADQKAGKKIISEFALDLRGYNFVSHSKYRNYFTEDNCEY